MKDYPSIKSVLQEIYPLHRTLASEGLDESLRIVGKYLPESMEYRLETYAPGKKVWTWVVPERYIVRQAFLETEGGEKVVDFNDNPLHLLSYSLPMDKVLSWEELEPHLYYSEKRPWTIPWQFKYYERSWGFCVRKDQFDRLDRNIKYHAVIDVEFGTDPAEGFRIGAGVVHPQGGAAPEAGEILVCSHTCHPNQANDDAAGVVTAIEVARRLAANPLPEGSMSARFLFCPETIGSIAYLAHHEDLIPGLRAGIFIEMTGNDNSLILQRSRQDNALIDRVARSILNKQGKEFREGEFAQVVANDERVINGPGVNVPCISISRWPYDEYHTSDDNPSIIHEDKLQEAADMVEQTIRIYAANYIPKRKFRGPVFLSGHGLWVDWRINWALNRAIEKIMMHFGGKDSIFEIAEITGLSFEDVYEYVNKFHAKDLVEKLPLPEIAEKG
jgi:aminopeptidase-like protein